MASASFTLPENIYTFEADTTSATATKALANMTGVLVNGGATKVFVSTNATAVATTDAQAEGIMGVPPGSSIPILKHYASFSYKTAAGTSVLYFCPDK